jgi:hypothetical protein
MYNICRRHFRLFEDAVYASYPSVGNQEKHEKSNWISPELKPGVPLF